jgi:hypothetical protein
MSVQTHSAVAHPLHIAYARSHPYHTTAQQNERISLLSFGASLYNGSENESAAKAKTEETKRLRDPL